MSNLGDDDFSLQTEKLLNFYSKKILNLICQT